MKRDFAGVEKWEHWDELCQSHLDALDALDKASPPPTVLRAWLKRSYRTEPASDGTRRYIPAAIIYDLRSHDGREYSEWILLVKGASFTTCRSPLRQDMRNTHYEALTVKEADIIVALLCDYPDFQDRRTQV